jgi:uncharacterized GH25 family protein
MNRRQTFFILLTVLFATFTTSAHDTWLIPKQGQVAPGTMVALNLTSGMAFPLLDTSIKPDRIDGAKCRLNGTTEELKNFSSAAKALVFTTTLKDAGLATCWVELKPRQLELTPAQVDEYFAEIDASQAVRQEWRSMKTPKRWREVYVKHTKTYITVGSVDDRSWSEPVGMSLEIIPATDPGKLRAGDTLSVIVLKNGTPFPSFPLGLVLEGNKHAEFRATDSEGRVAFKLRRAGKYMLRGTDLRRSTKADLEWESDFTTLTLHALPSLGKT